MSSSTSMPYSQPFDWSDTSTWANSDAKEYDHNSAQAQGSSHSEFGYRPPQGDQSSHNTYLSCGEAQPFPTGTQYNNAFNPNRLTPEQSVATVHDNASPAVDDFFWQEEFQGGDANLPVDGGSASYPSHLANDLTGSHLYGTNIRQDQLLPSPQLTATSTPEASGHSKTLSSSTVGMNPLTPSSQPAKRQLRDLDTDTAFMDSVDHQHQHASQPHPISPVIHISSHSRGDSPARSYFASSKSPSRSARSARQQAFPAGAALAPTQSTLRPPQHYEAAEDEDEDDVDATGPRLDARGGFAPGERAEDVVPCLDDMQKQEELESTISQVRSWLAETSLIPATTRLPRSKVDPNRTRSRSTGARNAPSTVADLQQRRVPGPGALLDEESDYHYSSDDESLTSERYGPTEAAPAPEDDADEGSADEEEGTAYQEEEPSPRQFFHRRPPWQDPPRGPIKYTRAQPESANAAMYKFEQRARNFETASRAATWGTGRHLSVDLEASTDDNKTRHLSLSKRTRERGASFINEARNKARELIPRRSNSNLKKHPPHAPQAEFEKVGSPEPIEHGDPIESLKSLSPRHSLSKQRSPPMHTGDALIAMSTGLAAVGASASTLNPEMEYSHNPLKRALHRVRSKSEVPKSPKNPTTLTGLIAQQGGMPVPALASPSHELDHFADATGNQQSQTIPQDELTVKMEFPVEQAHIIPNLEGFKHEILRLNPRLEPFLVERVAHDQLRRYKRLVKNKVDHTKAVVDGTCASRHHCAATGAEAEILPSRGNAREPLNSSQFKVNAVMENDDEMDDANFDGIVTPALFPEGIPAPPTTRLPARFECPLCFQVKSFNKPSDWTKHVHEDVQPFTCTFPQCSDPKSFKRKADWVRHENERHRHLEWWRCNLHECQHICYRKDNFVQHLVREHKKKEPKLKGRNPNAKGKGKINGIQFTPEERDFWQLVDECRHESSNNPRSEQCRFCGNCLNSWKKLSVHVGKHMEQIAMPVLELAEKRNVTKDTIISPVEPNPSRHHTFAPSGDQNMAPELIGASPYHSAASNYQSSSAGHSPAMMQDRPHIGQHSASQQYLDANYTNAMTGVNMPSASYGPNMPYTTNQGYGNFTAFADSSQMPYDTRVYPVPQMSTSSSYSVPQTQSIDSSYNSAPLRGKVTTDIYGHQTYFASPEMQQAYIGYDQSMMHGNLMGQDTTPETTQLQPVATSGQGLSNSYAYHEHHDMNSARGFYGGGM